MATWKATKEAIEKAGVKDEDDIWYLDFAFDVPTDFEKDEVCGWAIS